MPGLFQGLEIGKRALLAHQVTLQTIAHNIANVNTPGYTRQRVIIQTTLPEQSPIGSVGSGIKAVEVRNIKDLFLGEQFRQENKSLGQWTYKERILSQIEAIMNEPNDNTLSDLMNRFWSSWGELSNDPASTSARKNVLDQANQMITSFNQVKRQLENLQNAIGTEMKNISFEINSTSSEIARLNKLIAAEEVTGRRANDLRDNRDLLIDKLSGYIDVNVVEQDNGMANVYIGAMAIVDRDSVLPVTTETNSVDGVLKTNLLWEGTTIKLRNNNGLLKGMTDTREDVIPFYIKQLDDIADRLISEVNAIHSAGFGLDGSTGTEFFDSQYSGANGIRLNNLLSNNTDLIAGSTSGEVGDNTNVLAIYDLRDAKLIGNGTATLSGFYNSMVGTLGVESKEAQSFTNNYELLVSQITNAKQSVEGVSLNEEMTNMIKFQHAFDAAARVITAMDRALDTVMTIGA